MFYLQEKFAKLAMDIYAMESMSYMLAGVMDTYENPEVSLESAIVKVGNSNCASSVNSTFVVGDSVNTSTL